MVTNDLTLSTHTHWLLSKNVLSKTFYLEAQNNGGASGNYVQGSESDS